MAVEALERRPATWEEYQALAEDVRAEYIDGEIVMVPAPRISHQNASRRLANLLEGVLPEGYLVVEGAAWKPGANEYVPDVMVCPDDGEDVRFTGTPALCVEVTSTNRANDYVTKVAKYAMAGLPHYWVLDPAGTLDVLVLEESGHYRLQTQVSVDQPEDVSFGIATACVNLTEILR